jgi:hypothetical protein
VARSVSRQALTSWPSGSMAVFIQAFASGASWRDGWG